MKGGRPEILDIAHGTADGLFPPQTAADLLKDGDRLQRDIRIKTGKFYGEKPTNEQQRVALEKLSPLIVLAPNIFFWGGGL